MKIFFYILILTMFIFSCSQKRNNDNNLVIALQNQVEEKMRFAGINEDSVLSAVLLIDSAINISPENYILHVKKMYIYVYLKMNDEALDALNRVLKLKPKYAEGWVMKGILLRKDSSNIEMANESLRKAINLYDERLKESKDNRESNIINKWWVYYILYENRQSCIDSLYLAFKNDETLDQKQLDFGLAILENFDLNNLQELITAY